MTITIDIGNSRIKWALWQAGEIVSRGQTECAKEYSTTVFDNLFLEVDKPSAIYAICVAEEAVVQALNLWIKSHWQAEVVYIKTEKKYKALINAYAEPAQHGVDRWMAVVAAYRNFPETAICVINAGTATVFDLIDKNAQHLGGYILPSFYTMHKALLADTANVASTLSAQLQQEVPNNTSDAVNQGLHKFMQSGIRDMCRLAEDVMGGPVQLVLTGGFAKNILAYSKMPDMCHKPDLVMQGMYEMILQQQSVNPAQSNILIEKLSAKNS